MRVMSSERWSLLAWLRGAASSDSLSSAGSDRSAASFAFLAPPAAAPPAAAPRPRPPTDSYKKRVHDGHLQRQHDRDLTLHRKYGLYYVYDAFSLPPAHKRFARTDDERRERRATSESLPRRVAHVPGKRRAPLPPARPHSLVSSASLARRYNRKRPAPQPPVKSEETFKENILSTKPGPADIRMNSKVNCDLTPLSEVHDSNGCKTEKHSKKYDSKDTKISREKSFLKQIFENKKRNSTTDTPERILPSISELDKQAAEIIELCKLKPLEQNNNMSGASSSEQTWFCTRCLRKYNSTVVTCQYCLPEQKRLSNRVRDNKASTSCNYSQTEIKSTTNNTSNIRNSVLRDEEKQKLKEMLKEMKDSLPKKPKHEEKVPQTQNIFKFEPHNKISSTETPTLRIGSTVDKIENTVTNPQASTSRCVEASKAQKIDITNIEQILPKVKPETVSQNVIITQHVVLVAPGTKASDCQKINEMKSRNNSQNGLKCNNNLNMESTSVSDNLHTPLKISSLLNPVYIPKNLSSEQETAKMLFFSPGETKIANLRNDNCRKSNLISKPANETIIHVSHSKENSVSTPKSGSSVTQTVNETKQNTETSMKSVIDDAKATASPVHKKEIDKSEVKVSTFLAPQLSTTNNPLPNASTSSNNLPKKSKLLDSNMIRFNVEQHSRRRDLINQLEQSIATGDERAAAEAATKLAQLRLACSVLSFSSQIMAESSKSSPPPRQEPNQSMSKNKTNEESKQNSSPLGKSLAKVDAAVQFHANALSNVKTKSKEVDPNKVDVQISKPTSTRKPEIMEKKGPNGKDDIKRNALLVKPSTSQVPNASRNNLATIQVWVEDREATRGPLRLRIPRQAAMGELRREAESSLGLAGALQRWIVGRALCTDDRTPLVALAGPDLAAPFYLCVVESDKKETHCGDNGTSGAGGTAAANNAKASDVYAELVQLEKHALVTNAEPFDCTVCMEECAVGTGAVLRECVHTFCRECLSNLVRHCEEPIVYCPAMGCPAVLQEREIRELVTREEYEKWLARGLVAAESGTRNAFHCRTRDCTGWAFIDPDVRRFPCPVCKYTNCIPCQNIHEEITCEQYRAKLQEAASTSCMTDEGTQTLLNSLIAKGEALQCPECSAIITKKWGCDWVKCSACKTEICWVTRGRRWGPAGKGDTSAGCRCGVDGKRCHPSCGYCH